MFFFFSHILAQDYSLCVFDKKPDLCKDFVSDNSYIIQQKEILEKINKIGKENNYFESESTYIWFAEDVPKADINISSLKRALNIYLNGIDSKKRYKYKLNAYSITTFDNIYISNSHCIKDETTQFFVENLTLSNVEWDGFNKMNIMYGENLCSDFHSLSNNTFKFNHVKYSIGKQESFYPNYKVDGAVITKDVEIYNFPSNAKIGQYGEQLIIIPENEEMGFRRTNFIPADDKNITYTISASDQSIIAFTSFFSNREAIFTNVRIVIKSATVIIEDGKWGGNEHMNFLLLDNSYLVVNTSSVHINLLKNSQDSCVQFCVETIIETLNLDDIRHVSFIGEKLNIETLILDDINEFDLRVSDTNIGYIDSVGENASLKLTGSKVLIQKISSRVSFVECDKLYLISDLTLEINQKGHVPKIIAEKCFAKDVLVHVLHDESIGSPSVSEDVCFLEVKDKVSGKFYDYINNNECPIILNKYNNGSVTYIGFLKEYYNSKRTTNYCITNKEKCSVEGNFIKTNVTDLHEIINGMKIPENVARLVNPYIVIDVDEGEKIEFNVNIPFKINSLIIEGNSPNTTFVKISTAENIVNIQSYENVTVDLMQNDPIINSIKLFGCTLAGKTKECIFNNTASGEFDFNTYHMFDHPLTPNKLTVWSKEIKFDGDKIIPNLPPQTKGKTVKVNGVETIGKISKNSKGYSKELYVIIDPAPTINFTTKSFGKITFRMEASKSPINVNFKAVLPVDFIDKEGKISYNVTPHFYGTSINISKSKICSPNIEFNIADNEIIDLSEYALNCGNAAHPKIKTCTNMKNPYVNGVINMEYVSVNRSINLNKDSYLYIKEFSNPDDDFLVNLKWTLNQVPLVKIKKFSMSSIRAFRPSIQPYIQPSDDDEYIHKHAKIYNMGIPFFCIGDSEYRGSLFHDGLLFRVGNKKVNVSTIYHKTTPEALPASCLYFIPYNDSKKIGHVYGPKNKVPWILVLTIDSLLIVFLVVKFVSSMFLCKNGESVSEMSMNIIGDDEF